MQRLVFHRAVTLAGAAARQLPHGAGAPVVRGRGARPSDRVTWWWRPGARDPE